MKTRKWLRVAAAAAILALLLAAIIWDSAHNGSLTGNFVSGNLRKDDIGESPPRGRSKIQDELSRLKWVTQAFLPINEFSRPGTLISSVNAIVIHYVGNPGTTAAQNRSYFAGLRLTGATYASSNFIIGLDGEIVQCVPVDEIAYASNSRNGDTLSIELCHPDETGKFTDETYASAVRLTAWLCGQYGLTSDDVIRHYDITGKDCPKYFVENEDAWVQFKADVASEIG